MGKIERVTMFKIPKAEDRQELVKRYETLSKTAVKDGKPYIVHIAAGPAGEDARSKGWNFVTKSTFASKADFDYYDNECEAHQALRKFVGPIREDAMTVWFEGGHEARL